MNYEAYKNLKAQNYLLQSLIKITIQLKITQKMKQKDLMIKLDKIQEKI